MGKSKKNVCWYLYDRQTSNDVTKKKDFKILRTLICHSARKFNKCWTAVSKTRFTYEAGRLFSENFKTCHFGYSVSGGPVTQYKHQHEPSCKIEDALIYKGFHENFHIYDNKGYLFVIESRCRNDSLVQYSLDTGQPCRRICLSNTVHFKHISWVEHNEMFVITSKQMPQQIRFHGQDAMPVRNITTVMAVFSAFPCSFVGMFEIDKRVFGSGVTSAMLTQNLLILLYSSGHTKCYSFQYILENFKLFNHIANEDFSSYRPDCGVSNCLPMNIKITECPPVLFEVRCAFNDVKIGGFPWHYIIQPFGSFGTFNVHAISNHKKAKQGSLESAYMWTEADFCGFHNDSSGRILHLRSPEIGVYSIIPEEGTEDNRYKLTSHTVIDLRRETKKASEEITMTSSGRCVRRRQYQDVVNSDQEIVIQRLDYEDELDLTWVALQCRNQDESNFVNFYDNQSFQLLREICLESKWEETLEYNVYVDLDTIIQVVKPRQGRYVCTIYRLCGSESPNTLDMSKEMSPNDSEQRDNKFDNNLDFARETRRRSSSRRTRNQRL